MSANESPRSLLSFGSRAHFVTGDGPVRSTATDRGRGRYLAEIC